MRLCALHVNPRVAQAVVNFLATILALSCEKAISIIPQLNHLGSSTWAEQLRMVGRNYSTGAEFGFD